VTVFLIRHAIAGSRSRWQGDDVLRPLSARGREQAAAIADLIAGRSVAKILSSPATRCVQTVEPLADVLGLTVKIDKRLAEGGDPDDALDVVLAGGRHLAVCAHGDLIPAIMVMLVTRGMQAEAPERCQKGSVWEVELRRGRPIEAHYHPPAARGD